MRSCAPSSTRSAAARSCPVRYHPRYCNTRLLPVARQPWEAQIPVAQLRAAQFPKLVVSGDHSAVFDAVCDLLQRELDAERAVIVGAGHGVPLIGAPFIERLQRFLSIAEANRLRIGG